MTQSATDKLIADNLWRDISEAPEGTEIIMDTGLGLAKGYVEDFHQTMRMPKDLWATHFRPLPDDRCANALKMAVEALNKIQSGRETVRLATLEYQGQKTYAAKIADEALAEINQIAGGEDATQHQL